MASFGFGIPSYDTAMLRFIDQVVKGFYSVDPLLGQIPWRPTEHGGPVRNVRGSSPLDQVMPPVVGSSSLSLDAVANTSVEDYAMFLYELATSNIRGFKREFFRGLGEVVDAGGISLDAGGRPLSPDMLLEMFERYDLRFDEDGNPQLPSMVVTAPSIFEQIKAMKLTPEQERRYAEIMERKKTQYHDKKRHRRLS